MRRFWQLRSLLPLYGRVRQEPKRAPSGRLESLADWFSISFDSVRRHQENGKKTPPGPKVRPDGVSFHGLLSAGQIPGPSAAR